MDSILTVTGAAESYDLTTLDNVKAELSVSGTASDTLLGRYITGASVAAAQFCNRVFVVETVSERFLPGWQGCLVRSNIAPLQLARWPLVTVASVTEDAGPLTLATDYLVDPANGQLVRVGDGGFSRTWSNLPVVVAYSAGYATIPADLEDAVIRMVTARYLAKGRDKNIKSDSVPGIRDVQYWIATGSEAGAMTPDVTDVLENYRVPVLS